MMCILFFLLFLICVFCAYMRHESRFELSHMAMAIERDFIWNLWIHPCQTKFSHWKQNFLISNSAQNVFLIPFNMLTSCNIDAYIFDEFDSSIILHAWSKQSNRSEPSDATHGTNLIEHTTSKFLLNDGPYFTHSTCIIASNWATKYIYE